MSELFARSGKGKGKQKGFKGHLTQKGRAFPAFDVNEVEYTIGKMTIHTQPGGVAHVVAASSERVVAATSRA